MSLVMGFITPYCVVMSGDYRKVAVHDTSIYYDDARKLFHVNNNVLIGLTGDYHVSQQLLYFLAHQKLDKATANAVARICRQWLRKNTAEDVRQRIMIAGKADNGKPVIIALNHSDRFKLHFCSASPGRIEWKIIHANVNPLPIVNEEYERLNEITPETLAEMARKVNERVAVKDSFVSAKCDVVYIGVA
jgi:hypothetical protein